MISLSEKSKETASSLMGLLNSDVGSAAVTDLTPDVEILGNIYKLMVKQVGAKKLQDELDDDKNDQRHFLMNKRHQEILDALNYTPAKEVKEGEKPTKKTKVKKQSIKKKRQSKKTVKKVEEKKVVDKKPAPAGSSFIPTLGKVGVGVVAAGVGATALAKIKGREGYRQEAYYDPKRGAKDKYYSVGFGHQITDEEIKQGYIKVGAKNVPVLGNRGENTTISKADAESLVEQDYKKYENYAKSLPNFSRLNGEAQMALIDMSYNMGVGWANKWPSINKQLEEMNMSGVANNIRSSVYAKQVGTRAQENALALEKGLIGVNTSQAIPSGSNNIGSNIDASSKQNKELHEELNTIPGGSSVVNQTNINTQTTTQNRPSKDYDDRSAYEKKSRFK